MKAQEQIEKLRTLQESFDNLAETYDKLANTSAIGIEAELQQGKQSLVSAIEYKGGTSNAEKSFQGIAQDIEDIPNFPTTGFEYISERPRTLMEAYVKKRDLIAVEENNITEIRESGTFTECNILQRVRLSNLVTISGFYTFQNCSLLQSVELPNLVTINGGNTFINCSLLQSVELPNLVTCKSSNVSNGNFANCTSLHSVQLPNVAIIRGVNMFLNSNSLRLITLGTLIEYEESLGSAKPNLRNITIGQDTNINLPFNKWTATNVIAEGQSGIDELNTNLYNNLLTKLYDHSTDGQTRTLRLGWLAYVTQENIDYANSKGWTLTT